VTGQEHASRRPLGPEPSPSRRGALAALAAALLVVTSGVVVDQLHFAHGISAEWRAQVGGRTLTIHRTVEHDPRFRNRHRALARYVAGWTVAEHGIPTERPSLDAYLRSRIRVPEGASRGLTARSPQTVVIAVDGHPIDAERRIEPGWHLLEVHWTGRLDDSTALELTWENSELVPRSVFHPMEGPLPASRAGFWLLVLLLSGALSALVLRAETALGHAQRMARWAMVATLLVVSTGVGLRAWQYDLEPEPLESYDEYFDLWKGWSLLEDGTSRGFSAWPSAHLDEVEREAFSFWGTDLTVVSPCVESPPLMHLLVGTVAHLAGTQHYLDCRVAHGRLVSLGLSALTIWLLILVGRRLTPSGPGPWLGAMLYAATPSLVLQTRIVNEELVVLPLALATLFFFLRWRQDGRRDRDLLVAAACAGVGVFAKVPAVTLVPGLAMLVVATGEPRAAARALAASLAIGGTLSFGFALWQGPDALLRASAAELGGRGLFLNVYPPFFDVMQVNGWMIGRGWLLFFWVAAVATLYRWPGPHRATLVVPAALYLTAIGVGLGNDALGWYPLPIIAYLVIAAGVFLADLWERPDVLRGTLFGLLFVMYSLNLVVEPFVMTSPVHQRFVRAAVTLTAVALTAPYCLAQVWPGRFRNVARSTLALSGAVCVGVFVSAIARWEVIGPALRDIDHHAYFP
jgi:hypothetical protein